MHLKPADFFTTNPALDVPSTRNQASVLVPCCGQNPGDQAQDSPPGLKHDVKPGQPNEPGSKSAQGEPFSHLQSGASDMDAKQAGAHVENDEDKGDLKRRLSKVAQRFFGGNGNDAVRKH